MVNRSRVLDRTFGALSNPTRRAMVKLLAAGPMRVTDLAEPFDVSLAAVSKHIRTLERAGLVRRKVRGRDHVLTLDARALREARDWIERCRSFWERRLDALDAHLREDG